MSNVQIVNPYCIVNYFHYDVSKKQLDCRQCPMECELKKITMIKW